MRHSDLIGFDKKMIVKSNAIDFFQIGWIGLAENSSEGLSFFFNGITFHPSFLCQNHWDLKFSSSPALQPFVSLTNHNAELPSCAFWLVKNSRNLRARELENLRGLGLNAPIFQA